MFQRNIDTFPKKYCQQISSLLQNIMFQYVLLIGHGQVSVPTGVLKFFILLLDVFCCICKSFTYGAAVYFLYDLSPITVTIKEERRSFLHFLTRLCAVLGGTFALTGFYLIPSVCQLFCMIWCFLTFKVSHKYQTNCHVYFPSL